MSMPSACLSMGIISPGFSLPFEDYEILKSRRDLPALKSDL